MNIFTLQVYFDYTYNSVLQNSYYWERAYTYLHTLAIEILSVSAPKVFKIQIMGSSVAFIRSQTLNYMLRFQSYLLAYFLASRCIGFFKDFCSRYIPMFEWLKRYLPTYVWMAKKIPMYEWLKGTYYVWMATKVPTYLCMNG